MTTYVLRLSYLCTKEWPRNVMSSVAAAIVVIHDCYVIIIIILIIFFAILGCDAHLEWIFAEMYWR